MPSSFSGFPTAGLQFLKSLKRNNRREWFQPRKHLYEEHVKEPMLTLVAAVNRELARFAPNYITDPKKALFRIYRDTRFSNDKTPYKTHVAAYFSRRGSDGISSGGYYVSVSADSVEIAGGLYHPGPETLLDVRNHIANHYQELQQLLSNKNTRKLTGDLSGDRLQRMPKGFLPDHPAADYIKMKDWFYDVTLPPAIAATPKLLTETVARFRAMSALIDFLNAPLQPKKRAAVKHHTF